MFDHASAIGRWGPFFLELIELHDVTPELESRFYTGAAGGSNIAHIAYVVDDRAAECERLEAARMPRFLQLRVGPVQISLHDAPLLGHAAVALVAGVTGAAAACVSGLPCGGFCRSVRDRPQTMGRRSLQPAGSRAGRLASAGWPAGWLAGRLAGWPASHHGRCSISACERHR